MQDSGSLILFAAVGIAGGLIGMKIKLPGSVLICSLMAVIIAKIVLQSGVRVPGNWDAYIQIALGIRVGMGYTPELGKQFLQVVIPVVFSTVALVLAGLVVAIILVKLKMLNIPTAYLSTSPGGMSALISMALDSSANPGIVAAFHFFRIIFILITAPFFFHFLQKFVNGH